MNGQKLNCILRATPHFWGLLSVRRYYMIWTFDDYTLKTGVTIADNAPYASLKEFGALVATGPTLDAAIATLRVKFEERIDYLHTRGEAIPAPGDQGSVKFAPDDQIRSMVPEVEEFWEHILHISYRTSFVSNESTFASWEHYCGGRVELIRRVKERYGVDITEFYDLPIPQVLRKIDKPCA